MESIQLVSKKDLFLEEEGYYNSETPGFVELWDFSRGNLSQEERVQAVSKVASVCYGNEGLKPNFKLFDKLSRESIGLPSSSFEFVPVLLNQEKKEFIELCFSEIKNVIFNKMIQDVDGNIEEFQKKASIFFNKEKTDLIPNTIRYGYNIDFNNSITNLRALMYDLNFIEKFNQEHRVAFLTLEKDKLNIESDFWYNNESELDLIKKNFFVFRKKITIRDARQDERHRRSMWQELSRRYTSGEKVSIEFRLTEKLNNEKVIEKIQDDIKLYQTLTADKVPTQEARDVLPVSIYTTIWNAWYPDGIDNYLNLRTKSSAQKEIRSLAVAMEDLLKQGGLYESNKSSERK